MNPGSRWLCGLLLATSCVAALAGCAEPRPTFDAARAYANLTRQTQFGPRIPGTSAHEACLDWMRAELGSRGDTVIAQEFRGAVLGSPDSAQMTNLIVRFRPTAKHRILIGAHWDTRSFADNDPDSTNWRKPIDGANDGGSGVAILMELARAFDSIPPPMGIDLVFLDGEDMGGPGDLPGDWCQGSRYFSSHLTSRYEWGAILDMVGGKDLRLPYEGYSQKLAPEVVDRIWKAAEKLGETSFQRVRAEDVYDDHMPFLMRGIKVIDLIDFDYRWWHTIHDTADNCSAESLGTLGRVLLAVIYE
jgi:Zn-dependent M28 family amino/carboxypeptidase